MYKIVFLALLAMTSVEGVMVRHLQHKPTPYQTLSQLFQPSPDEIIAELDMDGDGKISRDELHTFIDGKLPDDFPEDKKS